MSPRAKVSELALAPLMLLLHSSLTFLPARVGQPQKMTETTAQVVQVYFSNTTRDIQEQCFPWAAPRPDQLQTVP